MGGHYPYFDLQPKPVETGGIGAFMALVFNLPPQ
jgi:hypothetical protein